MLTSWFSWSLCSDRNISCAYCLGEVLILMLTSSFHVLNLTHRDERKIFLFRGFKLSTINDSQCHTWTNVVRRLCIFQIYHFPHVSCFRGNFSFRVSSLIMCPYTSQRIARGLRSSFRSSSTFVNGRKRENRIQRNSFQFSFSYYPHPSSPPKKKIMKALFLLSSRFSISLRYFSAPAMQ